MSSCYQSLHIDTSKERLAFEDFPVPEDWPDFPHHSLILQYFNDYVDHFDLRGSIRFNTAVERAVRREDGAWEVTTSNGNSGVYQWLFVCTGHHWDPRMPDYPGLDTFAGHQMHSHYYIDPFEPFDFRGQRVLVVGAGNSAMDIASELSQRPIASKLIVSMRRGVWVLPKYVNGRPVDQLPMPEWLPQKLFRLIARRKIKSLIGDPEGYGLPRPDHPPLNAHPSISSEFLTRVGCGDIIPRGAIERFREDAVLFEDGSSEPVDAIIWATGYKVSFPFFEDPALRPENNRFPLFKRLVKPGYENLFFVGLAQAIPTLVPFAEQQSKMLVELVLGRYRLPSPEAMQAAIIADEKRHMGHFYNADRHTMQLDFGVYCNDLGKEIKRGRARAGG